MEKVYIFKCYCGSMGELEGMFVAEEADVAKASGQTVHFGEVLGKHSDIEVELDASEFEVVSEDPVIIEFVSMNPVGINPFEYMEDEDEEDDDED